MKPFWTVFFIFAASAFACSSVFAEDKPRSTETAQELRNVTQGKPAAKRVKKAPVKVKKPRFNPEDVGC